MPTARIRIIMADVPLAAKTAVSNVLKRRVPIARAASVLLVAVKMVFVALEKIAMHVQMAVVMKGMLEDMVGLPGTI